MQTRLKQIVFLIAHTFERLSVQRLDLSFHFFLYLIKICEPFNYNS